MLRVIFANEKMKPRDLQELADSGLSLLHIYWSKEEEVQIDKADFVNQYCIETQTMTKPQATKLVQALNDNFEVTVQKALDVMYNSLRQTNSRKVTQDNLNKVKDLTMDEYGMVSDSHLKVLFNELHNNNNRDVYEVFNDLYVDVTGEEECPYRDYLQIFSKPNLIKTLIVSAETL